MAQKEDNTAIVLSEAEKSRLDKMNWDRIAKDTESTLGIAVTREMVEAQPEVAKALANFEVTPGLKVDGPKVSGNVYLRSYYYPESKGENAKPVQYTVTVDTKEEKKTLEQFDKCEGKAAKLKEAGFSFGNVVITSRSAVEAMLQTGGWLGENGQRRFGQLNANAGRPIAFVKNSRSINGKAAETTKTYYLVGYDPRVNKFYGTSVKDIESYLKNTSSQFYGVKLGKEQIDALATGGIISVELKNGQTVYGQYSPVKHDVVAVHPAFLAEAEKVVKAVAPVEAAKEEKKEGAKKAEGAKKTASKGKAEGAKKAAPKKTVKKTI